MRLPIFVYCCFLTNPVTLQRQNKEKGKKIKKSNKNMERKRFVLAAALGCLIAFGSVSAQEETGDNDTYEKFRVGGYGEMVANF